MKKLFAILFILILPICVWGQNDEAEMLLQQGKELLNAEKYEEAIPFFEKCYSLKGKYSAQGLESLFLLSNCYSITRNFAESIKNGNQLLEIWKEMYGDDNYNYASTLILLSMNYHYIGNYQEAIKLGTQAVDILKKVIGEEDPDYASALNNLAVYYTTISNYQEAIRLISQAVDIYKKTLGEEHHDYAMLLNNLATYYAYLGNFQEALKLSTQALKILKQNHMEQHSDYAAVLSDMAKYYNDLGNYQEAIKLNTQALEIQEMVLGKDNPDYACILNSLATNYKKIGNYQEAIKLGTQAMEIRKMVLGEKHPDYASSLNDLANYYCAVDNYQEAIILRTEAMEIQKKVLGEEHPNYATSLHNLAIHYAELDNYQEAIRLNYEAMEIQKKVFGEDHFAYCSSLVNMTKYYFYAGEYEEASKYLKQTYNKYETLVLKTFAYLTNKERSLFWNTYSDFFNDLLPRFATIQPNYTLKTYAINGQLLSKGLLLNADIEIQNLIETQNNEQLKAQYYKIKQDRKILDELYQLPINKRTMNADSLSKVIDNEERNLIEACQEIGDYTKNLSIKWTDVQQQLNDNDIAIEFTNFTENDTSNNYIYIAFILKKGMPCAELVKLDFSETDTVDYTTPSLYNKIWKPLDQYLQDVQNVYFSPTGKFHNIGIEYLPDENGEIFAKKYSAYRLSSTRELAIHKTPNPSKKAAVFGGIVYDFDEADWQNVSNEEAERAGLTFLKGAKKESEEITQILSDSSFTVTYGTDKAATEESFKKISGSGIKILHIATHGFYEPENKENSFANLLAGDDENSQEDLSLSRSGLFLAGASTGLDPEQRKNIPDGVDDGILTAKEISRMDFKGLDLVVLSACQTGLGEVTSEGVFGLQRGFKKAGAQTIVMSLWNVSDKPTRELMTDFYRNLVAGKSKREAFISAQDKIRLKYINPQMWAGFIMVDGIEY